MVNTDFAVSHPRIRSRRINDADVVEVVNLLTRGFSAERPRKFWEYVLASLASRQVPHGLPRYGYIMESNGKPVGVILQIYSTIWMGNTPKTRCNGSSWYVEPEYRSYAPLLVSQAFRDRSITVLNVSPAPHTRLIAEIQGYSRYSSGLFLAVPTLGPTSDGIPVRIISGHERPDSPFEAHEQELLRDHAAFGCISLWCVTPERAYPFVFRPRIFKRIMPSAQLVYCRELDDLVRFARPIGRYLAQRARFFVMIDSNGPIDGLVGKYFHNKMPKYFWGPDIPRLGDLAYTETAMFGI